MLRIDLQLPTQGFGRNAALRRNMMGVREMFTDPSVLGAFLVVLVLVVASVLLQRKADEDLQSARVGLQQAVQDSSLLQTEIEQAQELERQEALVGERISRIRSVDYGRYTFVHLMDDVAGALPTDVWIRSISLDPAGSFSLEASAAPVEDLITRFIQDLESSPFIQGVEMATSSRTIINDQTVLEFVLQGQAEQPDVSFLQTETIGSDGTASRALPGGVIPGSDGLPSVPQIGEAPPTSSLPLPPGQGVPGQISPDMQGAFPDSQLR